MNPNTPLDISMDGINPSPRRAKRRKPSTDKPLEETIAIESQAKETKSSKARKKTDTAVSQPSWFENASARIKSERTRFGIGITLVIISVVMFVMLLGFLKTGSLDESLVSSTNSISEIANAPEGVENISGALGAKVSHLLFVDGLGIGAFVLAFYLFYLALALFGVVRINFWSFSFKCVFTAVALSIVVGLFTYNAETALHWGGNHGRYVNMYLYHISDVIGQFAVSIFLIAMLVVMYFHQMKKAYSSSSALLKKRREALEK